MKEIRIKGIRIRDYHLRKFLKDTKSTKEQLIKWLKKIGREYRNVSFPCIRCEYKGEYSLCQAKVDDEQTNGTDIYIKFDIYEVWNTVRKDKKQFNKLINFIKNYETNKSI